MTERDRSPFNLMAWMDWWFERPIPFEDIPLEFRKEVKLPNGRTQIIDARVPGWSYDRTIGQMVVCPDAWADDVSDD